MGLESVSASEDVIGDHTQLVERNSSGPLSKSSETDQWDLVLHRFNTFILSSFISLVSRNNLISCANQITLNKFRTISIAGRPAGPEAENSLDRESYSLASGLALGLVMLEVSSASAPAFCFFF